jgi:hypothetical protein
MKNISGLLYVAGLFLFYILVFTIAVMLLLSFYGLLALTVFWVMAKSYIILGNTGFFILWPALILVAFCYLLFDYPNKRRTK